MMGMVRGLVCLLCVIGFFSTASCSRSPAVVDSLFTRLNDAAQAMRNAKGDQEKAVKELRAIYKANADRIMQYRETIESTVASMSSEAREDYRQKLGEARAELDSLARGFPEPHELLRIISSML